MLAVIEPIQLALYTLLVATVCGALAGAVWCLDRVFELREWMELRRGFPPEVFEWLTSPPPDRISQKQLRKALDFAEQLYVKCLKSPDPVRPLPGAGRYRLRVIRAYEPYRDKLVREKMYRQCLQTVRRAYESCPKSVRQEYPWHAVLGRFCDEVGVKAPACEALPDDEALCREVVQSLAAVDLPKLAAASKRLEGALRSLESTLAARKTALAVYRDNAELLARYPDEPIRFPAAHPLREDGSRSLKEINRDSVRQMLDPLCGPEFMAGALRALQECAEDCTARDRQRKQAAAERAEEERRQRHHDEQFRAEATRRELEESRRRQEIERSQLELETQRADLENSRFTTQVEKILSQSWADSVTKVREIARLLGIKGGPSVTELLARRDEELEGIERAKAEELEKIKAVMDEEIGLTQEKFPAPAFNEQTVNAQIDDIVNRFEAEKRAAEERYAPQVAAVEARYDALIKELETAA